MCRLLAELIHEVITLWTLRINLCRSPNWTNFRSSILRAWGLKRMQRSRNVVPCVMLQYIMKTSCRFGGLLSATNMWTVLWHITVKFLSFKVPIYILGNCLVLVSPFCSGAIFTNPCACYQVFWTWYCFCTNVSSTTCLTVLFSPDNTGIVTTQH